MKCPLCESPLDVSLSLTWRFFVICTKYGRAGKCTYSIEAHEIPGLEDVLTESARKVLDEFEPGVLDAADI